MTKAGQAPFVPTISGWSNGLSQDYSKGLGRWFADRPGARQQLLDDVLDAQKQAPPQGDTKCLTS